MTPLEELLSALSLKQVKDFHFEGKPIDLGFGRLYGGHVLAQSLAAATQTVSADRLVHSLHGYFLRIGSDKDPITYEVDPIRDGRSFSTRRVVAIQNGKAIFNMSCSFQIQEEGFDHQISMPYAPAPEDIKSDLEVSRDYVDKIPLALRDKFTCDRAIEMKSIGRINPFHPIKQQPEQFAWFKASGPVPDNQALHRCLLAYTSDFTLMGTGMRPHGVSFAQKNMQTASLDHAMWFHRDIDMNLFSLYAMDAPNACGARGFNRGSIFLRNGKLAASVTQEGLMRQWSDSSG